MEGEGNPDEVVFRHRIALGFRHHDRSPDRNEIEEILGTSGGSPYDRGGRLYWKEHEKSLVAELGPGYLKMTGLYNGPFLLVRPWGHRGSPSSSPCPG